MRYDIPLRDLLIGGAPEFLKQVAGVIPISLAPAEFPAALARRADLIGLLPDHRYLHIEVETGGLQRMPSRMLGYYALLIDRDPLADVVQIVLYAGSGNTAAPTGLQRTGLSLTYRVVDVRSLDPGPLLNSVAIGDIVAAFLCRSDDLGQRVRDILRRLRAVAEREPDRVQRAFSQLLQLAGLRGADRLMAEEVEAMPFTINVEENVFLKSLYAEAIAKGLAKGLANGRAQGQAEGRAEGKAEALSRLINRRFGSCPAEVVALIAKASPDQIDRWLDLVIDADSIADLFAARG